MKKKLLLLAALLTALLLAACGAEDYTSDPAVLQEQEYVSETIYIGSVLPLSGENAEHGQQMKAAQLVAADIINKSHDIEWDMAQSKGVTGFGAAKIELKFIDALSPDLPAEDNTAAAKKLIDLGVVGLLGAYTPDLTTAAAHSAATYSVPMLNGAAQLPEAQPEEGSPFYAHLGATLPQELEQYFLSIRHISQTGTEPINRIAIAYEDTAYGRAVLAAFDAQAETQRLEVVARIGYTPGISSVSVEMQRLLASNPQVVFQAGNTADTLLFIDAYAASDYRPLAAFCCGATFYDPQFISRAQSHQADYWHGLDAAPALLAVDEWSTQQQTTYRYINSLYKERTGVNMTSEALWEFAAVITLAQAIGQSGCTDAAAISACLRDHNFEAPFLAAGQISFDSTGQNTADPGRIVRLNSDGTYTEVGE